MQLNPVSLPPDDDTPEEYSLLTDDDTLLRIELLTDEIELLSDDDTLLKHEPESPQETAANTMPLVAVTPPLSPASPAETVAPADDMRPWSPTSPHESAADTPAAHTPSRGQWLAGDEACRRYRACKLREAVWSKVGSLPWVGKRTVANTITTKLINTFWSFVM